MVALCFANGLQGGELQAFSQSTESLKHTLHVTDLNLGVLGFLTSVIGNGAAPLIAILCVRYRRTRVLTAMFATWAVLIGLLTLSRPLLGLSGFMIFAVVKLAASTTEATDPASYPLIADWWPVEERAGKVSVFNAGGGLGAFVGIAAAGVLVDRYGWRWAFAPWPFVGLVGAALMWSRREPARGDQDAGFKDTLVELAPDAALLEAIDEELIASAADLPGVLPPAELTRWEAARHIVRIPSWRFVALGVASGQLLLNALMLWGTPYFKRTFHLSGTQAAGLAPVVGIGTFAGILGGGFLADRLLKRGVLAARVWVTGLAYLAAAVFLLGAFSTSRMAIALPLLALGVTCTTTTTGPQYALLMDVTPVPLRSQAASIFNVVSVASSAGYLLVGGLSTMLHDNLRAALFWTSPALAVAGLLVLLARGTYAGDVALVVAEAQRPTGAEAAPR